MHLHDFFGNETVNEDSTPGSLRSIGGWSQDHTTCAFRTENRSAYWTPVLFIDPDTEDAFPTSAFRVYYREGNIDQSFEHVHPMPSNFGMIAGNSSTQSAQATKIVGWSCVRGGDGDTGGEDTQAAVIPNDCHEASTPPGRDPYNGEP